MVTGLAKDKPIALCGGAVLRVKLGFRTSQLDFGRKSDHPDRGGLGYRAAPMAEGVGILLPKRETEPFEDKACPFVDSAISTFEEAWDGMAGSFARGPVMSCPCLKSSEASSDCKGNACFRVSSTRWSMPS